MVILDAITKGIGAGLLLSIMIGPVFFSLLQNSMAYGYKSTIPMIVGVSISDLIYILICYFGIAQFIENVQFQLLLGLIGGLIMLVFGLYSFYKNTSRNSNVKNDSKGLGFLKQLMKGILINGINPSVLLFWLGMVSVGSVQYQVNMKGLFFFFGSILLTVFIFDNLKAFLSEKLSSIITTRFIRILNTITGIGFILFALKLFHFSYSMGIENLWK